MKKLFLIAATPLLLGACHATNEKQESKAIAHDHHPAAQENVMMKAMDESMEKMHQAVQIGNADHDFAAMMVPHHEGAIAMAEALLKESKSAALIDFAKKVISAQQQEVAELNAFLSTKEASYRLNDDKAKQALNQSMKPMMNGMQQVKPTGTIDHDFVVLMIPHHESAVAMAKAYLPYAKNDKLKEMAHQIIKSQEAEIEWLKKQ